MSTLAELVAKKAPPEALAQLLDAMDDAGRQREIAELPRGAQKALYQLVAGQHVDLDYYLPPGQTGPVRHVGKNSMPFFRTVDKRFVRNLDNAECLAGYNQLDTAISSAFSGPGYFTVQPRGTPSPDGRQGGMELFINYWQTPTTKPHPSWPELRENNSLPGSLVYGKMCDYMRRVSAHVSIGEAWRNGKSLDTFFIVARLET